VQTRVKLLMAMNSRSALNGTSKRKPTPKSRKLGKGVASSQLAARRAFLAEAGVKLTAEERARLLAEHNG
jgi:hypothetical protein